MIKTEWSRGKSEWSGWASAEGSGYPLIMMVRWDVGGDCRSDWRKVRQG